MKQLMELEKSLTAGKEVPEVRTGHTVKVHTKVREGEKERIQLFEGIVISRSRSGLRSMFTVRKISHGVGVEKMFPLYSPTIDKIEVVSMGKIRRNRLFYLRDLKGKAARIKEVRGK